MKISDIFGKRICGAKEGYIVSVERGRDGLTLVCADGNEREFCVPFGCAEFGEVVKYTEEKTVKNTSGRVVKNNGGDVTGNTGGRAAKCRDCGRNVPIRLGGAVFDEEGKFLGSLEDVTILKGRLKTARIGKKNYPFDGLVFGDVVILKRLPKLKRDVEKDGATLFKKGTAVTREVLERAADAGEFVQTTLKTI